MFCTYNTTKKCLSVGTGSNISFCESIGMTDEEVEQDYNGEYWLKGYAPAKPREITEAEQAQSELTDTETRISEIKDELLTAVLLDDAETVESLKAEYKKLMEG